MTSKLFREIGKRFWGDEVCADFSTYDGKAWPRPGSRIGSSSRSA